MNEGSHTAGTGTGVSGSRVAGSTLLHLLAGIVWLVFSMGMLMDRYLFCSNEPGYIAPLFLVLGSMWLLGVFLVGWIRSRGVLTWPWTLAWFVLAIFISAIAVGSGPEPTDCGFGTW